MCLMHSFLKKKRLWIGLAIGVNSLALGTGRDQSAWSALGLVYNLPAGHPALFFFFFFARDFGGLAWFFIVNMYSQNVRSP